MKTTLDGFGRTIEVDTGHDSVTVSVAETQYAPCACSPLGKLYRTSRPHAPGASPLWTTYSYDGAGRTIAVTLPDGSITRTSYAGNQSTVTDAAGKWKTYTKDAMGNLTAVTEPPPSGGANYVTTYTYNGANQLIQVSMPRPYNGGTYTQTRTFTWNGADLASETTPEAGTVSYQYDGAHHVTQRTDAKGQQTQYGYDSYGRLTQVRHYTWYTYPFTGLRELREQSEQQVNYSYDTNPLDGGFSQNAWGRLTAVAFHNEQPASSESFSYQYSYNTAGRVVKQRLHMQPRMNQGYTTTSGTTATISGGDLYNTLYFDTTSYSLAYQAGIRVRVTSADSPGNYMEGVCVSYSGTTVGINVDTVVGYGTFSNWNIDVPQNLATVNLEASYAWDNEGRMTSLGYPADQYGNAGPTDTYAYDAMGRLSSQGATWGAAGELLTFNGETRTYNTLGQLTRQTAVVPTGPGTYTTAIDMQYIYAAGQNNGRIAQTIDGVTGEQVSYTYDALNRLATAQTADASWGQAYTYDGWGNLTGKTVTKGTGPVYSANPDPSRNGGPDPTVVDPSLDVEQRNIGAPGPYGGSTSTYDQAGKMVFWMNTQVSTWYDTVGNTGSTQSCELHFIGITGQRLAEYGCQYEADNGSPWQFLYSLKDRAHKTAGILTDWGGKPVHTDRLGSVRWDWNGGRYSYYPYGEVRTAPAGQTGLYGDLEDPIRGYDSNGARFSVPDPMGMKAANASDPGSWNRYAYVGGDPVNFDDPNGTMAHCPPGTHAVYYGPFNSICVGGPIISGGTGRRSQRRR